MIVYKKKMIFFLLTQNSVKEFIYANLQFEELSSLDHVYWWFPTKLPPLLPSSKQNLNLFRYPPLPQAAQETEGKLNTSQGPETVLNF